MKILKRYYIYFWELIIGNIIFNFVYTLIKTITLKNLGAINENFTTNIITSFKETFIVYLIIYIILAVIQILYDKSIINKLNDKLNKQRKGGNSNEE